MTSTQTSLADLQIPEARDYPMFVDGAWVEALDGQWSEVTTPILRKHVIGRVPTSSAEDVDKAVRAAHKAFPRWKSQHFTARARILSKIADAIDARAEELARLTALDTGNALRTQARPEVQTLANLFRYFAGVAGEIKGTVLPAGDDQLQYSRQEPLGVIGCILPWNSPLMIAGFKIPAALVAGNTVVVKAAEAAPLSVLLLAEICAEHLPAGVLNVITGKGSVAGEALVQHPDVDKVSFTGSTEVGRRVAREAGGRLAHVSLELGGKNPSIVFPDVDINDDFINQLLLSTRVHRQGQSCTAGSRLFLHQDIYDNVLDRLVTTLAGLKVGNPLDEATDMGAIINEAQFASVCGFLDDGLSSNKVSTVLDGSPTRSANPRLLHGPDGVLRSRQLLAPVPGGNLRTRPRRHPVDRPRRRRCDGQRLALRARRLRLDTQSRFGAVHCPRPGNRVGAGQPGWRPDGGSVLRRLQAEWPGPRGVTRGHDRRFHPDQAGQRAPAHTLTPRFLTLD